MGEDWITCQLTENTITFDKQGNLYYVISERDSKSSVTVIGVQLIEVTSDFNFNVKSFPFHFCKKQFC